MDGSFSQRGEDIWMAVLAEGEDIWMAVLAEGEDIWNGFKMAGCRLPVILRCSRLGVVSWLLASVIVKLRCSRLGVVWLGVGSSEFRIITWV